MNTIELNTGLEVIPIRKWDQERLVEYLQNKNFLFPEPQEKLEANGFINYIALAYQRHYSVTITPTDIWYMMLTEIATDVAKNSDAYAALFTTTPGKKQDVIVLTGSPEEIDPHMVVTKLKSRVPSDVNTFMPQFSTDSIVSSMAMSIAFCDLVSPYYNYGTFMCGIPSVTIGGSDADWELLQGNIDKIITLFGGKLEKYLKRVNQLVSDMLNASRRGNTEHFNQMVKMERCGSGSDQDMSGWILQFMNHPDLEGYSRWHEPGSLMQKNVHRNVSKMEYKNLETERTFELYTGIFTATPKGQMLLPNYNAFRIETTGKSKAQVEKETESVRFSRAW